MNRRSFVSLGLTFAAFGGIPFIASSSANKLEQSGYQPVVKLLSALRDKQSAVYVGAAILEKTDVAIAFPDLMKSIMIKLDLSFDTLNSIHRVDLKARLQQSTAADFDIGAIANVEGWILSQTEAQMCALAAQQNISRNLPTLLGNKKHV